MQTISLDEHSSRTVELGPADAAYLAERGSRVVRVELVGENRYRLRTKQHVGVLVGPTLELRIQPKCSIGSLFHMLSHAYRFDAVRPELAGFSSSDNLFEFFVQLLVSQTEQLVRTGIRRSYRVQREELHTVRGRIDFSGPLAALWRAEPRIPCEYEELSEDVFENQVIRVTLERIRRIPLRASLLAARARRLRQAFARVSAPPIRVRDIERREYDRMTRHYAPIHGLCTLLLSGCGLDAESGDNAAPTFVIDMNVLFERFVLSRFLELAPWPFEVDGQATMSLDLSSFVRIRPDIVIKRAGRAVLAADTKYKRTNGESFSNVDVYQALAYARALGVRTAYLLYPAWEARPRRMTIRDEANEVVIDSVGLAGDAEALDHSTSQVFERMLRDALSS